jgi:cytochrome c553
MRKIMLACAVFYSLAINAAQPEIIPPKLTLCIACHGPKGISVNPQWPNLAGQYADYLAKQLQDYKKIHPRNDPTMTAIAANLSDNEVIELARFYAKQPRGIGSTPEKYLKRGQEIYRGGNFAKHITACIACHGPKGTGNEQAGFPLLSGQHAAYTVQQLQAFKDKKRKNDFNSIMRDISAQMDQEDMEAVAYYLQGLH